MKDFYTETSGAPYLEQGELQHPSPRGEVTFRLTPVGVENYLPSTLEEAKVCLRNLLSALAFCHARNWCIIDLRWDNVVFNQNNWYIIDAAEHAHNIGQPLSVGLVNLQIDPVTNALPTHAVTRVDMRQLERMWRADFLGAAVLNIIQAAPNGAHFLQQLLVLEAAPLLAHSFLQ
jgi:hypothetical protein